MYMENGILSISDAKTLKKQGRGRPADTGTDGMAGKGKRLPGSRKKRKKRNTRKKRKQSRKRWKKLPRKPRNAPRSGK